jgi:hypothetical protein
MTRARESQGNDLRVIRTVDRHHKVDNICNLQRKVKERHRSSWYTAPSNAQQPAQACSKHSGTGAGKPILQSAAVNTKAWYLQWRIVMLKQRKASMMMWKTAERHQLRRTAHRLIQLHMKLLK